MKLILWTLAIDDDRSTRAAVFTSEREAQLARFHAIADTPEEEAAMVVLFEDGKAAELEALIEATKKADDTYSVSQHDVEFHGLTVVGAGMLLLS